MMRQTRLSPIHGFTLVEVMIIVVCLAIAVAIVVPSFGHNDSPAVVSAARQLVSDLDYARTLSLSRPDDPVRVVFDKNTSSYFLAFRSAPATPIADPIGPGPYRVRFGVGRAAMLENVTIHSFSLGGDNVIAFGPLGELDQVVPATIVLKRGSISVAVSVDPVTGDATASNP